MTEQTIIDKESLLRQVEALHEREAKRKEVEKKKHELPKCAECKKNPAIKNYKKGLICYSCLFLPKFELTDWIKCPKCGKDWNKLKTEVCYDCEELKLKEFESRQAAEFKFKRIFGSIKAMNLYTFQRFKVTMNTSDAHDACRKFDHKKDNLYLWGPCGTGKSHLAYATAKMYAFDGMEVIISTPMKLVDSFRTKNDAEKERLFEDYSGCDLLLIDDLGISKYTDFGLEILCEILNRRTLQMRSGLIVTSNLSLERLAKRNNDDRLASRLDGLCKIIELSGEDYRQKKESFNG